MIERKSEINPLIAELLRALVNAMLAKKSGLATRL
jgi:hypothetical protein